MNVRNRPRGYDRRLVGLMHETFFATEKFNGVLGSFALTNGDPTRLRIPWRLHRGLKRQCTRAASSLLQFNDPTL